MKDSPLEMLNDSEGKAMYFLMGKEIAPPKMLLKPVITRQGQEIIAFSEGGLYPHCIFTKAEVEGFCLETVETIPEWIIRLISKAC